MIGKLRKLFEEQLSAATGSQSADREHAYRLATAALLVEMTRADAAVAPVEERAVAAAVRRAFDLPEEEIRELLARAEEQADEATSLYEFTRHINAHLDDSGKRHVIELLWRVAYADGNLDMYEEYLVRKIADLIHVPHAAFIRTKLEVQTALEESGRS